jgi:putative nucleotide binding protein
MTVNPIKKDEWAVVLDFLARGHSGMQRSEPVAQVIGESYFSLLEVITRENAAFKTEDRVYIGEGKRTDVKYIRKRICYGELTAGAKEELHDIVEKIVVKNPNTFLNFFNRSGPVTTRLHQLELLPGIGKRHLWGILEERKKKPFESFNELKKRVPLLPNPEKLIVRRILCELEDKDKYRIFVPRWEKKPGGGA